MDFRGITLSLALVMGGGATLAVAPIGMTPAEAQATRFARIDVDGNRRIETATILSLAGIAPGQALTPGEVNAAIQRIRASGLFEEVSVRQRGATLSITVDEFPTVNRVAFEGNQRLNDDALARLVESTPRRVFDPAKAERDAAAITQAYADQGRLSAVVAPRIIRRSENRVDLVFEIREGGLVEIERIGFVGNRNFSDRRLRRVLETKQAGALRLLVRRDTFVEDRIEFDRQVLTDFYRSRGYVDFRVVSVNNELARSRDGFFLTFNVIEGQQFRIGRVTASSDLGDIDPDLYAAAIRLREGSIYSPVALENNITRLERLALQQGLNFIRVSPRITRNDRDLTLDVDFEITRGPRIFVERIDIEGNTTTLDRVVRRQFRIVEGDPFNPREVRQSAERIRALGYFANADVNAREGSSPDQVVVDVDVTEQPTGSFSFGGNFSTENGFGLVAQFSERNFLGRGQTLSFQVSTAESNRQFGFRFVEPGLFDRDLSLGVSFNYERTNNQNALYSTETFVISPSLSFPVSENGRLTLRAFVDRRDLFNSGTSTGIITSEVARGAIQTAGLGYSYNFDNRRGGLNPRAGVVFRFGQDFGLTDDARYVRTTALAAAETRVLSEDVTLRATVEGGALAYQSGSSRVTDRFFLGQRQIRGFEPGGIGPRERNGTDDDALGGEFYAVARFEAEFPIGLPEEYGITGGAFVDVGSVWGLSNTAAANGTVLYEDASLRSVVGVSVFWDTPIGPLRFNFTETLRKEQFDRDTSFDLTISTQF
ncbi:MAG: outer membrane protein assembly factor BamA [Shimia sp.]